jgi:hypothetical protein
MGEPVAIWNGEMKCTSLEHDTIYDAADTPKPRRNKSKSV